MSGLRAQGLEAELTVTEDAEQAVEIARTAALEVDAVVAVGGDGTLHHVVNGLIQSGAPCALGVIPFGTGNDFVKMLDVPVHLESAIKIIAGGKRKVVDYGVLEIDMEHGEGTGIRRFFVNTLGIGLDAEVSHRATSFKMLPGFLAYLAALLNTLNNLQPTAARIVLDDAGPWFDGEILLSSVGNGTTSGGLFKLTPTAAFDDGWLDVCVIEGLSVPGVLWRIPRVLRGTHTGMRQYHAGRAKKVVVTTERGLPVHADGEIVTTEARRLTVQIVEKGVAVIVPG